MGAFGGGSTVENMMSGTRPLHVALPQAHLDNLQVYGRLETWITIFKEDHVVTDIAPYL